jgi:hypothetical protein
VVPDDVSRRQRPGTSPDHATTKERSMTTRVCSLVLCLVFAMLGPLLGTGEATHPGNRSRNDAVLYELMEHAAFTMDGQREATSALQGTARRGSPLCPEGLQAYAKEFFFLAAGINVKLTPRCSVVAIGRSLIDVNPLSQTFGTGEIRGEFWVVVNSDATNKTDAQELVVMSGEFAGAIQVTDPKGLVITVLEGSTLKATAVLPGFSTPPDATFTGKFRLPFTNHHVAAYKNDRGRPVPVLADEHALGKPTVRLEVTFD